MNQRPEQLAIPSASTLTRALGMIPALVIIAGLAGFAFWGWRTEWRFGLPGSYRHDKHAVSEPLATVRQVQGNRTTLAEILFTSPEAIESAGIDVAPATTGPITDKLSASGEVQFDPSRMVRLSSRSSGSAAHVFKTTGDQVKPGELIALIDSSDVGRAKSEFQQALVQLRLTERALANVNSAGTAVAEPQRREVQAALRNAEVKLLGTEQTLVNLGLPIRSVDYRGMELDEVVRKMQLLGTSDSEIRGVSSATANLLPIRSTIGGVVLSADVVMGEVVDPSRVLFVVADPQRVWLTLHVPADGIQKIRNGQSVQFRPDGTTNEFPGVITWIGTAANETTRTIPIRAEAQNLDGKLRASTLGVGQVVLREEAKAVLIPSDAVFRHPEGSIVFVRHPDYFKANGPKSFFTRIVTTGAREGSNTEVRAGLKADDVVAVKGASVLFGEFKRALGDASATTTRSNTP